MVTYHMGLNTKLGLKAQAIHAPHPPGVRAGHAQCMLTQVSEVSSQKIRFEEVSAGRVHLLIL